MRTKRTSETNRGEHLPVLAGMDANPAGIEGSVIVGDVSVCVGAIRFRSEWDQWEVMTQQAKGLAADFIVEQFGNRCIDFEDDCPCCQRWKALDELFANPYDEPGAGGT